MCLHNILKLENFNKESGIYFVGSNKYQILKEIQAPEYKDDYNEYCFGKIRGFHIKLYCDYK